MFHKNKKVNTVRQKQTNIVVGGLVFATAVSAITLTLPSVSADVIDNFNITVPVSCSISGSVSDAHSKDINNGTTESEIGATDIKVLCNDNTGYAIYAIGYTNNEYGNTVLTDSSLNSTHDIITNNEIIAGTSSWAMKLEAVSGAHLPIIVGSSSDTTKETGDPDYSDYAAIPEKYTKVAYYASNTDMGTTASGSNITTTYRAYISQTQPAGTYVGKVKYTLVHPSDALAPVPPLNATDCPANSICFAPNASDVKGSMASLGTTAKLSSTSPNSGIINVASNSTATLIAPNFYRTGYGFAGWSTDFAATEDSIIYGPNETISTGDLLSHGLILYPVWIASSNSIQNWTGCNELTVAPTDGRATLSSVTALKDERDNNVYTVARLADGKCWMVENLRLNSSDSVGQDNIAKSQGYADATVSEYGNLGKFIGLSASEDTTGGTSANYLYSTNGLDDTINLNTDYNPAYRFPRYNGNNTNMVIDATNSNGSTKLEDSYTINNSHARWYGYGNYYTWAAAIASTGYYNQDNASVSDTSICPSGWHLPEGGKAYPSSSTNGINVTNDTDTYRDFYNLGYHLTEITAYENMSNNGTAYYYGENYSNFFRTYPNNFVYSGFYGDSAAGSRNVYGFYWSSSVNNYSDAYNLNLYSDYVYPGTTTSSKYLGYSIRCISD